MTTVDTRLDAASSDAYAFGGEGGGGVETSVKL